MSDFKTFQKDDLRLVKTERALMVSMHSLLNERKFKSITVDRICKNGQISRATFYAHFTDKYDFLKFWLQSFWKYRVGEADTYEDVREPINQFVDENRKILKNLLYDVDVETLDIIVDFLCLVLNIENEQHVGGIGNSKNIVAVNLYIGGIVNYILWQVRNNFPPDVPMINEYSFGAIKNLWDWIKK